MHRAGIWHHAQIPPARLEGDTEEEIKWVRAESIPVDSGKAVQAEQWPEGGVRDPGGKQLGEMTDDEHGADQICWNALLHESHSAETADWPDLPYMKSRDGTRNSDHHYSTPGGR